MTDEQLRDIARSFTDQSIEAAAVNEALALRARVANLEAWAKEWHDTAETICLLAGVSQGLGADEMVIAFRDTNDALRARVAKLEAALERARNYCAQEHASFAFLCELDAALKDAPQ